MIIEAQTFLPADIIFHPHWWHKNYGLTFGEDFFFDAATRVQSERMMRRCLYERFGDCGLGELNPEQCPVIGPVHLAAGFMASAVLGCEVRFFESASPQVVPRNLTDDQIMSLEIPDILNTSPMRELVSMMDELESEYGYLEGDVNWGGVQNVALDLRGQQLFVDYHLNPALATHLLDVVAETELQMASYIASRTGTTSLTTNRIIASVDPRINLHSNCSVVMVSNDVYEKHLLRYDQYLAENLQPYGIHFCGNNMEHVRKGFAKVEKAGFFDVGWGSSVALCREALPDAFFSLRLSPVRLKDLTTEEIRQDVEGLLQQAASLDKVAVCCINMDYGTPDDNIREIFKVVEEYRCHRT